MNDHTPSQPEGFGELGRLSEETAVWFKDSRAVSPGRVQEGDVDFRRGGQQRWGVKGRGRCAARGANPAAPHTHLRGCSVEMAGMNPPPCFCP